MVEIDEEKSVKILENILQQSGLKFHRTQSGEEGGFFVTDEHNNQRKLTREEIFDEVFGDIAKPN